MSPGTRMVAAMLPLVVGLSLSAAAYAGDDHRHGGNRGKDELIPLTELIRSEAKHFFLAHATDQQTSDRYYLNSWALSFYLTFERKLLGTPQLDEYVRSLRRGSDPAAAVKKQ